MANPLSDLTDVVLLTIALAWVGMTLLFAWLAPRPNRRRAS